MYLVQWPCFAVVHSATHTQREREIQNIRESNSFENVIVIIFDSYNIHGHISLFVKRCAFLLYDCHSHQHNRSSHITHSLSWFYAKYVKNKYIQANVLVLFQHLYMLISLVKRWRRRRRRRGREKNISTVCTTRESRWLDFFIWSNTSFNVKADWRKYKRAHTSESHLSIYRSSNKS